jgi:elongation factor Ts
MLRRASLRACALARARDDAHRALASNARAFRASTATNDGAPNKMGLIKSLRERTGAPIVDVKSALAAHDYDVEAAFDALRTKGLAAAAKKAGRTSADGLVGVASDGNGACVVVEVNSETDFVARNDEFQALVREAVSAVRDGVRTDAGFAAEHAGATAGALRAVSETRLTSAKASNGMTLEDLAKETAVNVRENVRVRRAFAYAATDGAEEVIGTYVHGAVSPGVGRQAACVVAKGVSEDFANKLAMHAVASSPLYLRSDCVPSDALEREMSVFRAQTEGSGKPANIVEKILAGRVNKYYEEVCFENQKFVLDDSVTVAKAVKAEGGEIVAFSRVKVGEGIEVEEKDFASEVAEAVRTT